MTKELAITGYQVLADKNCSVFSGILFQNPYPNFHGNDTGKRWISLDLIKPDDSCIGKNLEIEYGYKGRIVACSIK